MLSTLLNSLATYFSKFFIVASFLPTLVFSFFNGAMAFLLFESFHDWVTAEFFGKSTNSRFLFITTAIAVALLVGAYVLSALNNYLRGILEGKWPDAISRLFVAGQVLRLHVMQRRVADANRIRQEVSAHLGTWIDRLRNARIAGEQQSDNKFSGTSDVVTKVKMMRRSQLMNRLIEPTDLANAVDSLESFLKVNKASARSTKDQAMLGELHQELVSMIQSTGDMAAKEHMRLHNELTSRFGDQQIAPTTMGNIANTIQSYAVRRYNCNLELFWSELQRVVQKDANAYIALQESKAQLDFLISCCWLTLLWSFIWTVVLGVWGYSVFWFWMIAVLGPTAAYFWYRAGTEHYRSFADVLTTSLDLFRLELLEALHIPIPADVEDERNTWDTLHRLTSYGEDVNLRYRLGKPTP
jgi:hypothetical protein